MQTNWAVRARMADGTDQSLGCWRRGGVDAAQVVLGCAVPLMRAPCPSHAPGSCHLQRGWNQAHSTVGVAAFLPPRSRAVVLATRARPLAAGAPLNFPVTQPGTLGSSGASGCKTVFLLVRFQ